ncbi:MAG TPA: dihydropteroate synthase [Chloroflexota bacterium]|nr:dihydropteroate synthase [Chloroflexota bacterium]
MITARVLSLPTESDVREEASLLGVPFASLEPLVGTLGLQAVVLQGIPTQTAAFLKAMVPSHLGLIVASQAGNPHPSPLPEGERVELSHLPVGEGSGARSILPLSTQHSALSTSTLLIAAPPPLLRDMASRLEAAGDDTERAAAAALRTALDRYLGRQLGTTLCRNLTLEWGSRTYVMGIINVTQDSFSGDGLGPNVEAAVEQGRRFVEEGADILDVGGESTRPGFQQVPVEQEIARVVPVVRRLAQEFAIPISVDSYKLPVMQAALDAGANMVNDIWGLRTEGLADLTAAYGVPIVLMHNRRGEITTSLIGGHFRGVQYHDLMGEIVQGLQGSIDLALQASIKWENIIVDPGLGFGKTPEQNLVVMRRLRELCSLGRPILMGTSRKSVIGKVLGLPPEERVEGTAATVAVSIANGADIVRVHDVKAMSRVARMTDAITRVPSTTHELP